MSNIKSTSLSEFFSNNYSIYGASTLMDRAIPDIRDGLLPVQRRILFTFFKEGELNRFRKAAVFVGKTLLIHAHGDLSLYSSIVRLAQPFNKDQPLIDAQGNCGSLYDFEGFAAQRYLELKMSKFTSDTLFSDIDKNTTDFVPNYDKTINEPVYLPSKFPVILNSGAMGIGSGFATGLPIHSVTSICNTTIAKIKNPKMDSYQLAKILEGPDYPTGGIIINSAQLPKIYAEGQGSIKIIAKTENFVYKGKDVLRVTELPYKVSISKVLEEISALCKDEKHEINNVLQDVKNITDKSTPANKVDLIFVPKKNVDLEMLKLVLFKFTSLKYFEKYIANTLYNGKFFVNISLEDILAKWIEYRVNAVKRKYNFLIKQRGEKLFLLNALLKAQNNIKSVIQIVKESNGKQDAINQLVDKFGFVEKEADYIVSIQLYRISNLEVGKLQDEIKAIKLEVDEYIEILSYPAIIDEIIINELEECAKKYKSSRRTQLLNLENTTDNEAAKATVEARDLVVSISTDGYIYSKGDTDISEQGRGTKGSSIIPTKYKKLLDRTFLMHSHDDLYCFTNTGKLFILPAYKLDVNHVHINNIIPELKGASIIDFIPITKETKGNLLFVTTGSFVKKSPLEEYNSGRMPSDGLIAVTLNEGEELVAVSLSSNDDDDLCIITTSRGYCSKMEVANIELASRVGKGRRKISLREDEMCLSLNVASKKSEDDTMVLVLTQNGFGKLTKLSDLLYKKTETGISAAHKIITLREDDYLIKSKVICGETSIIVNTASGKTIKVNLDAISSYGRNAKGLKIINVNEGDVAVNVI